MPIRLNAIIVQTSVSVMAHRSATGNEAQRPVSWKISGSIRIAGIRKIICRADARMSEAIPLPIP